MPLYRTITTPVLINTSIYETQGGVVTTNSHYDGQLGSAEDYTERWRDPNWKTKIAKSQDASQPYIRRQWTVDLARVSCSTAVSMPLYGWTIPTYTTRTTTTVGTTPIFNIGIEDTDLADQALASLKRKLNNRTQSFNTLVPLAEIRDLRTTIVGLTNLTSNMVGALIDVKRGHLKGAYKKASQIWLTYSFGVKPMLADIRDLSNSITSYLTRYDSVDRLTGTAKKSWFSSRPDNDFTGPYGAVFRSRCDMNHELKYKYITGHKFNLESDTNYDAINHFGLDLPSLVPALWELTAFSWVFDYFTTVGDFLDDTFTGTTGTSVYVNRCKIYRASAQSPVWAVKTFDPPYVVTLQGNNDTAYYYYWEFTRTVLAALPARALRFRSFDEVGRHGVTKLLNLVSVLSNFR